MNFWWSCWSFSCVLGCFLGVFGYFWVFLGVFRCFLGVFLKISVPNSLILQNLDHTASTSLIEVGICQKSWIFCVFCRHFWVFFNNFLLFLGVFQEKPPRTPTFGKNDLRDRPTYQNTSNTMLYHS